VRELTFDPGPGFDYVPGQWVSLRIPQPNQEEIARAYSIASAPRSDGGFDVAVTRVENGPGSLALHSAQPGEAFRMSEPQGFFTLEPPARPVLMVATGTGVAPMRSMLSARISSAHRSDVPFVLLFGVRAEADVLYRDEFERLASERTDFRFEPTLSRGSDDWRGRRGYVQLHLHELVNTLGGECDVYVCGLNRMIREVRRVLKEELKFTRDRIHTERYD
jgi:ferredoxin-NADP reductase